MLDGVRTTAPARTLIDAAGVMSPALVATYAQRWIAERKLTLDALAAKLLMEANLAPTLHRLVTTRTGHTFELDWAYPDARIGLELDGYGVHLRSLAAFEDDRWRRNELEIEGWTILNFTSRQCRNVSRVAGGSLRQRSLRQRFVTWATW